MFPTDNLAQLQEQVRIAHLRHASGRSVKGRFSNAYQLWRRYYEAKAALRDQNPAFAARLLPGNPPVAGAALGFFPVPAGVYAEVDKLTLGMVVLTVEVAATITVQVVAPNGTTQAPPVTSGPTRQTATFEAWADGLYKVRVLSGATPLATAYVPVMRARFLDFRELSRDLAFDFRRDKNPRASDAYSELLAVLYAADAAAATGQPALYATLSGLAAQLPKAPTPTALFPRHD